MNKQVPEFVPDSGRIGRELIDAEILIENGIEPYFSLHCFEEMGYDIMGCFERKCPRVTSCLNRFIIDGYLIRKESKE
jgi:hypothetical protein